MYRPTFILCAALAFGGCSATNDSGVRLHKKPDLSRVAPGTSIAEVAALQKPLRKEPMAGEKLRGAEVWVYEWDLPDDGVNNRMFTSVVVRDGVILGHTEETGEKWRQNAQLHTAAKVDSALEDVASLKATAARYQRLASLRESYNTAPYADTWELLMERIKFMRGDHAWVAGMTDQDIAPAGLQAAPPAVSPRPPEDTALLASADPPGPLPGEPAPLVAPPKKTLRELEAEELRIRGDNTLTRKERLRRLHEVWKQQREVTGTDAG